MFTVTVSIGDCEKTCGFEERILLSDALERMGIFQHKPCGGKGICEKCRCVANGIEVLACQTFADADTYIKYNMPGNDIQGLTEGFVADFRKDTEIDAGLGMAVDIGTTTVAAQIYRFPEGELCKSVAVPNLQAIHGADVISRIEYAKGGGLEKLQKLITEQLNEFCRAVDEPIDRYVITGNTVMLHLLTGKDPSGIAVAPFVPQSLFGEQHGKTYLPKCISAYIGADITCAILASGMLANRKAFLVDIGTNGEMVLWNGERLLCCSTAAGPAFEGGGISQGTLAVSGAVNKVYIENGEVMYTTVGDKPPVGICGTGIIDALACMKKIGVIDESGYLEKDFSIGDSGVFITPEDVRQVQLAKAAIRAGIDTLLQCCDMGYDEPERFYIAGGFGSFINIESACEIGLIPREIRDRTVAIGNAALSGAAMILQSREALKDSENAGSIAEVVELSENSYFAEKYMDSMFF